MELILFIIYMLVYVVVIIKIIYYKGQKNYGLHLSRKWIYFVVLFELIYLLALWGLFKIGYIGLIDFIDSIVTLYFRGFLLSMPILLWLDSNLPVYIQVGIIYIFALIFDYMTFWVVSCIKGDTVNQSK